MTGKPDGPSMADLLPQDVITLMFRLHAPSSRAEFVRGIHHALDIVIHELVGSAHLYQPQAGDGLHEVRLANFVARLLKQRSCNAVAEELERGHCDIVIKPGLSTLPWTWHGEAKIHEAYDHLTEGMKQLMSRYANGIDTDAGLLVFIFNVNAKSVVQEWRTRIKADAVMDIVEVHDDPLAHVAEEDRPREQTLRFCSIHKHEATGNDVLVRHMGIPLYFKPVDKSAVASAEKAARKKAGPSPSSSE